MLAPPPLPRNLEASFRDLDSQKPDIRAGSVADLARHAQGDAAVRARAIPRLVTALRDPVAKVRAAAAVALADVKAEPAVPSLVRAVDDDDAYVRQMAINALGEIGDAEAASRLQRALHDDRPEVRYQAVIAYAKVEGDAEAVNQALLHATHDADDAVVHIALRVVEERVDEGHSVDARFVVRARALVTTASAHVKIAAAIFLGKNGDSAGDATLLQVVRDRRVDGQLASKEDESAAVELAGSRQLEAARPALERRVWGLGHYVKDTCAFHAKIALAAMGHPRAVDEILRDLSSTRGDVLASAVVAAGRARLGEARSTLERLRTSSLLDTALVSEALRQLDKDEPCR